MQKIYGARFEPQYQTLRELNSKEVVNQTRLTIFNDAHTMHADGEYKGKKNFRFVVGSTQPPSPSGNSSIYLFQPFVGDDDLVKNCLSALKELNWVDLSKIVCQRKISIAVFDSHDRSLYLVRFDCKNNSETYYNSTIFIDPKCNFSSEQFENSLELPANIVYRLNYLDRELVETVKLEN
jgi:hypothetical protein